MLSRIAPEDRAGFGKDRLVPRPYFMHSSRSLYLLLAGFILVGLVYGFITPLFEAPDEQWHFAFVQNVAQGRGLPQQALPLTHLARQEGSQPPLYYLLAAALTFWIDTSDFPAIVWENPHYGFDVPGVVNDNKNLFIHTAQEAFPYRNTALAIHLARLLSLVMGTVAVFFTYQLTRSVGPQNDGVALAAAALVAFTPQFLFISSAVSNDSSIVALCAVALFLLVRALRSASTVRDAVLIGVVCGLCALAKVSGLGMLVLALLVLAYANRKNVRQLVMQAVATCAAFAVVAGWWYARNVLMYGEITGTRRMVEIFGGRVASLTLEGWQAQLREVFETFWVGFGWGNIPRPSGSTLSSRLAGCSRWRDWRLEFGASGRAGRPTQSRQLCLNVSSHMRQCLCSPRGWSLFLSRCCSG